jgi:ParB/RepB/Spo0J family partition protein
VVTLVSDRRAAITELPIEMLRPAGDNPRSTIGPLDELAASIQTAGILQPLLVMPIDGGYQIVCGERRWRAAQAVGLRTIPCLLRDLTENERLEAMIIENLQRSTLTRSEEARAYQRLIKLGYSQRDIARRVGKSPAHICRRLRLLDLPASVRTSVDSGQLAMDKALGYETPAKADDVFAADENLQRCWLELRREVLAYGNQRLVDRLTAFATAYVRSSRLFQTRNRSHTSRWIQPK